MSTRKYFHDSVTTLPPQTGAMAHGLTLNTVSVEHPDEQMKLHFSLDAGNDAELQRRVENGERITPAELDQKYGLASADTTPLTQWLAANGYQDISVSSDHTSVFASAPASTVAKTLQVDMVRITKDGLTYTAARDAPSLPDSVSANVHAITGLQPFVQLNKHRANRRPQAVAAAQAAFAGANGIKPPFLPSTLLKAYQGSGLPLDGSGQTIGILIDTFPNTDDLKQFWQAANVPATLNNVKQIQVGTGPLPPPEGEESLDAEWTTGMAPGAVVQIYATGSLQFSALNQGLQRILDDAKTTPSLRQVSISLGLGELDTPAASIRSQSQIFLRLAALGVNVFVSSGDAGSNPNPQGQSGGQLQVEYPASDPNVVGVGGTSLTLNAAGGIQTETAWSGSGGGKSVHFTRPAWQKGKNLPAGTARMVPDVAAVADPNTGALVVLNGKPLQYGGTSWSAPTWAGIMALVNQARGKAGQQPMAFLPPVLYKGATGELLSDVLQGSNGSYDAGPGYDMVTGLGSPIIASLKNLH